MSNALTRTLMELCASVEAKGLAGDRYRQQFHVMPPVGWLNDPNGLCQVDSVFHVYFQYAPFDVNGGLVFWGHATSRDLLHWEYDRAALAPDTPYDCHGAYSGSAVVHDGKVTMLYTGNVKLPDADGTFDYVNAGRVANTLMVETSDGSAFGSKRLLMTNADYPADDTCHVRDPFVWWDAETGRYLMLQGARRRGEDSGSASRFAATHGVGAGSDVGEVLVFASDDLLSWELVNRVSSPERFGFMWECPGYAELPGVHGNEPLKVLSVSPQGLEGDPWDRRNIYQSGYFPVAGDVAGECSLGDFRLWDAGFDFYAPQVFRAQDGRVLLIGWMGVPRDEKAYGNDPTVAEGWQHCLTFPRELTADADGVVLQAPAREIEAVRGEGHVAKNALLLDGILAFDLEVENISVDSGFHAVLGGGLHLDWRPAADENGESLPARFEMRFDDPSRQAIGCGRAVRWEPVDELKRVRVVADTSSVEVFVNDGELVMSTRYYPEAYSLEVDSPGSDIRMWELCM